MTFSVGQKVVCVYDFDTVARVTSRSACPQKGQVYTVKAIKQLPWRGGLTKPCILVDELPPAVAYGRTVWFEAEHFRPVVERKTNISIFTAMLNPSHDRVSA